MIDLDVIELDADSPPDSRDINKTSRDQAKSRHVTKTSRDQQRSRDSNNRPRDDTNLTRDTASKSRGRPKGGGESRSTEQGQKRASAKVSLFGV